MLGLLVSSDVLGSDGSPGSHCDSVTLDSYDRALGLRHDQIRWLVRSRGTEGPVIEIQLTAPDNKLDVNRVRRLSIDWDPKPISSPYCKRRPDRTLKMSVMCFASLPQNQLRLLVVFEPENTYEPEAETKKLLDYVANAVLC